MERDYVEIAGIKWATMNVGAEKETDFGLYFQYGTEQGYPCPTNLCKFDKTPTEFCDSVQANWGGNWIMPTKEEFYALYHNTTTEWVENYQGSGVNGRLFTDRNDSSKTLFFPACGFCMYSSVYNVGNVGYYWSSSIDYYGLNYDVFCLLFSNASIDLCINYRHCGFVLRGVLTDK